MDTILLRELGILSWTIDLSFLWALGWTMIIGGMVMMMQRYFNHSCFFLCPRLPPAFEGRLGTLFTIAIIISTVITTQYSIPHPIKPGGENFVPPGTGVFIVSAIYRFGGNYPNIYTEYPPLSWLGVVLLGMLIGQGLNTHWKRTKKMIGLLSISFLFGFTGLRLMFYYRVFDFGSIRIILPHEPESYYTFFALSKYPPSFTFLLWTTGLNLGLLWIVTTLFNARGYYKHWVFLPLLVFGSAPLFFLLLHLWILALMSLPFPAGVTSIGWIYVETIILLYVLFPTCYLYKRFKHTKSLNSLWRLL